MAEDAVAGGSAPRRTGRRIRDHATPLSSIELSTTNRIVDRVHSELRTMLSELPEEARGGGSALARALGIDRATCQRVLTTARRPSQGADLLFGMPGVEGLREFAAAAAKCGASEAATRNLLAALGELDALIKRLAGSHAHLCRRLRAPLRRGPALADLTASLDLELGTNEPELADRRWLFLAATRVVGRASEATTGIQIVFPADGAPGMAESVTAMAHIGHRTRAGAIPLVLKHGRSMHFASVGRDAAGALAPIVPQFCSPEVIRNTTPGASYHDDREGRVTLVQVIDAAGAGPFDLVTATRSGKPFPHPTDKFPPVEEMWLLVTFPARHALLDVYVHHDLARGSVQSLEVHLWGPDLEKSSGRRWTTRLPGGPPLQLLGRGLERAASPVVPRHAELTQWLFDSIGLSPNDFVGYRCTEQYPIWRAGYRIARDFT